MQTKVMAKVAAVTTGLAMATSMLSLAPMAHAAGLTPAQVSNILGLLSSFGADSATLANVQAALTGAPSTGGSTGGTTSTGGSCNVGTANLMVGSSGMYVTALQQALIGAGFTIPAGATGTYGPQTKAAVMAWQTSAGVSPASGYFGPISRAAFNLCTPPVVITPPVVTPPTSTVPGCVAGALFSATTGAACTPGGTTPPVTGGPLMGGAGSVETYTLTSGLSNEEVGEDTNDVQVAGLEIEADSGSDLEISAVRLVFVQGTANHDFDKYASDVSVWLDGKKFATVDADAFNDDNTYTKTISLENGAVIKAGATGKLVVGISGISNLDSADATDTWTVDFRQVRFTDADGTTISEDPSTGTRTFSFENFATASDVEFKIQNDDDDINDDRTIQVDANDDTNGVAVLSFTMEAEGDSDVEVNTFGVSVTVTGAANTDDVLADLTLWIDGVEVDSANTVSSGGSAEPYIFDDIDYTIPAGKTVKAVLKADFLSIADALDEGDTISFNIGENQTDTAALFDLEDEAGDDLSDANKTGSTDSGAFELRSTGIKVTFVSASESVTTGTSANDDVGSFSIVFNVEAFGGDIYVDTSAAATTATTIPDATLVTNGVRYLIDRAGTATVPAATLYSGTVTFSTSGGGSDSTDNVLLNEGDDSNITLNVSKTDSAGSPGGQWRVLLKAIGWATTDTQTTNTYDFNLDDFKTDYEVLN